MVARGEDEVWWSFNTVKPIWTRLCGALVKVVFVVWQCVPVGVFTGVKEVEKLATIYLLNVDKLVTRRSNQNILHLQHKLLLLGCGSSCDVNF